MKGGRRRSEIASWAPTAQVRQELLKSRGPELGHALELRKPVSQRALAWTQGRRELVPGAPDEDPKGQAAPAGTSEHLGRTRCPRYTPALLGGREGRPREGPGWPVYTIGRDRLLGGAGLGPPVLSRGL